MGNSKRVEIKDIDNTLYFNIRLFGVEDGLDFLDKLASVIRNKDFSIKPFLSDLLPLASLLDARGDKVVKDGLTIEDCYSIFQNPLAVVELGTAILEHQKVFMENSKLFRPLMKTLDGIWNTENLGLETK